MSTRIAVAVPPGYVARLSNGTLRPVVGVDRDGVAVVINAVGNAVAVTAFGTMLLGVEPVDATPPAAPPPAPRAARTARREPEPVAEEPEPDEPRENPWLRLREQARHLTAVD